MIYGQATFDDRLRSLASSLDVVAHELFHGVTAFTSKLEYVRNPVRCKNLSDLRRK